MDRLRRWVARLATVGLPFNVMFPSNSAIGDAMSLNALLHWLKETTLSQALSESDWMFPAIESAHVVAITLVVGTIAVVDLRLLGLTSMTRTADRITGAIVPLTWVAFACAAVTGLLLFIAKPVTYGHNGFFLAKLCLIGLAGANMLTFHMLVQERVDTPLPGLRHFTVGQASGLISLAVWTAVVACGRWIGFTI